MKKQITKKELEQLYNEQKLTIKEIGIKINKSATTVRNYMEKYNIKAKLHKKEKECIVCGKIYTGKINSKYCSDKCKRKAYKKRYKKECLICGNNFTSANKKSKYCSQRCRTRAAYKTKLEGYKKYKSNCLWCGNEFELVLGDNFSREQKYCSKKCADAKWAKDRVAKKNNVHEEDIYLKELYDKQKGICGLCGKKVNFDTDSKNNRRPTISYIIPLEEGGKHNYKNAIISHIDCHKLGPSYELKCKKCKNIFLSRDNMEKYCSRNCKKEDNPETCEWCGKKFVSYFGQKMYCSDKCTIEYQEFKRVEKKKAEYKPKEITCKECGLKFRTEYGDKRKSFCSDKCSKRYLRRTRKAKRRANFIEAVSLSYIIKRDGGKCQICGCKVSEEYNNKDMKIPTRDHIVPVSVGGEHSKKNIQLACLECNIKKGNGSVGSQLRLFG